MEGLVRVMDMEARQKEVADEFDKYNNTYASTVDDALAFSGLKADFFAKVKASYLIDILDQELGSSSESNILDVGCGIGIYHPLIGSKVGSVSGCDVSEACVNTARAANPGVDYAVYEGGRLPYDDGAFDAAFTICVMHHVPPDAWSVFCQEMARVVRAGGVVVVFEHNPRNPLTMRVVNRCPFDKDAVLLKPKETNALLRQAGLQNVSHRHILNLPAAGALLRRVDGLFSWCGLGAQYYCAGKKA